MIPYFEQPTLTLGPLRVSAFGAFAVAAIVTGWRLTAWQAARLGLNRETAERMARLMVMGGFVGAATTGALTQTGFSSMGGMAGSLAAALLYLRGSPNTLRYFDAAALAFPWSWLLFRAGCALAHDHPGAFSASWLAVQFPGGPRWDLGLLEMLAMIPIAIALSIRGPRPNAAGSLALLYGALRLALTPLQADPGANVYLAIAGILVGAAFLLARRLDTTTENRSF